MWAEISGRIAALASSPAINWPLTLIGAYAADEAFRVYLNYRQYKAQFRESPSEDAVKEGIVEEESFMKAQLYQRAQSKLAIASYLVDAAVAVGIIKYGAWPRAFYFWREALAASAWFGDKTINILTALTILWGWSSVKKPLEYYAVFVIEEHFGFNKSTIGLWIKDTFKTWVIVGAIVGALFTPMLSIIDYFGDSFVPYVILFMVAFQLVISFVFPVLVQPLFNKFTPLEDGELRGSIEKLAKSLGFPVKSISVADASQRSSHSNAYFIGFPWYKKIVLFDTIIKDYSVEEITSVVAHELGHWKLHHMTILTVNNVITVLPQLLSLSAFIGNSRLYESLGFRPGDTPVVFALLTLVPPNPIGTLGNFLDSFVSRSCEYAADRFAVRLNFGPSLRRQLIKMEQNSLTTTENDTLYSIYRSSHPTLLDRVRAIDAEIKKVS